MPSSNAPSTGSASTAGPCWNARPSNTPRPRRRNTAEASVAGYALSGKTTGLQLGKADTGAALADNTTDKSESFNVRTTTAHVRSERLALAQLPITEPIGAGTAEQTQLTLDGMVLDLDRRPAGRRHAANATTSPASTVSEIVIVDHAEHSGGFTTWHFASPGLVHRYVRATVTINANVVAATHGETVRRGARQRRRRPPNQQLHAQASRR